MPIDRRWTRVHTAATIAVLGGLLVLLLAGKWAPWFTSRPSPAIPPATINNVVLRIDSKLIRAQILMEDLVYAEGRDNRLTEKTRAVNQVVAALHKDLDYLADKVPRDNKSYLAVLARLHKWEDSRDKVVELMKAGKAAQAKTLVRTQCANRVRKVRDALVALEGFSQKRSDDFDTKTYKTYRQEQRDQ